MIEQAPTLVLLPGLGADHRLFEPQLSSFPGLIVPPWLSPCDGESLESFAQRMADRIPAARPLVIGGASFGGMVASHLAKILAPDALILLGTCLHPSEIAPAARAAASAAPFLPLTVIDQMRSGASVAIRALGPMTPTQRSRLLEMTAAVPAPFLRWAATAILRWKGAQTPACPVLRIHGRFDRIIPPPPQGTHLQIPRAGHIPSFTHPAEVNRAIAGFLTEIMTADG